MIKALKGRDNVAELTATGVSDWYTVDRRVDTWPMTVTLFVSDDATGVDATCEYCNTLEMPDSSPVPSSAIVEHEFIKNVSNYKDGQFLSPTGKIRLKVNAITTGTAYLNITQAG